MQVILLRDVSGIGQKGSVKNVSDGHALNFLIPNKLAIAATPEKLQEFERQQAAEKEALATKEKEGKEITARLNGKKLEMKANASPQGHLYEKISPLQIVAAMQKEWKIGVPVDSVVPKMPIKEIGEWPVEIKLGTHTATIIVAVKH